jgi:hypothetical protein
MSVLSKTFLSFVGRDLMSFSLFSARHDFNILGFIIDFLIYNPVKGSLPDYLLFQLGQLIVDGGLETRVGIQLTGFLEYLARFFLFACSG